jgi:glycosyltransferase involved in cell wall biosynthesis
MNRLMRFTHDRLVAAGHQVEYFCAEQAGPAGRGPLARFRFPFLVRRHILRAARAGRPFHVVNVHEPSAAPTALLAGRNRPSAVIVTTHGVERRAWELSLEERRLGRAGPSWRSRLWYPVTSLWQSEVGLWRADHVFCLSEEDRDYLVQRTGVATSRVTRIFPGANAVFAEASSGRDYGRTKRLLFAGTWRKNKGIEDFIPAFVRLARAHAHLRLTIAGAGVPPNVVRCDFPDDLHGRIDFVDSATEPETAAIFADADLYLLPSLFEGTPLTLIEAMMSGLPIVTTDTCGMKDLIDHDRTGLLIPRRSPDAIVAAVDSLLAHQDRRERLGRAAHATALQSYTWDRAAEPLIAVYHHLTART